jgi:hypothetical protein
MRIIKHSPTAIAAIAGEILNLETASMQYIDGQKVDNPGADYPVVTGGDEDHPITVHVKTHQGFIYVPQHIKCEDIRNLLIEQLRLLEGRKGKYRNGSTVAKYHSTVSGGLATNVKVIPPHEDMEATNQEGPAWRAFITQNAHRYSWPFARFTWHIMRLHEFVVEVDSDNITDSVSRHVCSVFYDAADICTLGHNEVTFEFSPQLLKGADTIIDETVDIFANGHPLQYELSPYWQGRSGKMYPHNKKKVYSIDRSAIIEAGVEIDGQMVTGVCGKCQSPLWGENYALAGHLDDPAGNRCVMLCPLCRHSSAGDVEDQYIRVFRVVSSVSDHDMINAADVSDTKKEIMRAVLTSVQRVRLHIHKRSIKCLLIGEHFAALSCSNVEFLNSGLATCPELAGRRICTVQYRVTKLPEAQ